MGPIFLRELMTVPRRGGHYVTRVAYLGALWVIAVTAWLATMGWSRTATLGDVARFGPLLFSVLTFVILALFLFFSALACANAVAREKDRRTFVLLLMTDLRNDEIVLGKMLGSLLPILALQLATLPFLTLLMLLGGIGLSQVIQATLVTVATSLAAGSLGGLVALWRDRTFQSLALTVLYLVLYLMLVRGLCVLIEATGLVSPAGTHRVLQWLEPFAAMQAAQDPFPDEKAFIPSAYGFAMVMTLFAVLLTLYGMWRLRVWNPSGEPVMQREAPETAVDKDVEAAPTKKESATASEKRASVPAAPGATSRVTGNPVLSREAPENSIDKDVETVPTEENATASEKRASVHAAPGATRRVTGNPILWREIHTRAYGRRPLMVKLAYGLVLALICVSAFSMLFPTTVQFGEAEAGKEVPEGVSRTKVLGATVMVNWNAERPPYVAAYGLLPVVVLSLLLVAVQATTSITSERDTGALDLLLVTDLSPKEFIFGKLLGVLYNTKEYLLPPLLLAGVYAYFQCLATPPEKHDALAGPMNATALLCLLLALVVLLAFACVLGVHVALRTQNSQTAIVHSLSTIFFLTVGTLVCVALILINRRFEYQWPSFLIFVIAGIGGLWYVLSGGRPSTALVMAAWFCPLAMLYVVINVVVGKPGSKETADPLIPALVIGLAFGFAITAMMVPLLSEFDVAMGRTSGGAD